MSYLITAHRCVIVIADIVGIVTGPKDTALNGQQVFLLLLGETSRLCYQLQMHLFPSSDTQLAIQDTVELLHMTLDRSKASCLIIY